VKPTYIFGALIILVSWAIGLTLLIAEHAK